MIAVRPTFRFATLALVLLVMGFTCPAAASGATEGLVSVRFADPAGGPATVGDLVSVRLDATELPPGWTLHWPSERTHWGVAEVLLDPNAVAPQPGNPDIELHLRAFEVGAIELPVVDLVARGPDGAERQVQTPENLTITIASVLPEDAEGEEVQPQPPAPPLALPVGAEFLVALGVATALLVAAIGAAVWRARSLGVVAASQAGSDLDPLAEFERALGDLDAIATPEAAHVALHRAVRRFLGRRLEFPGPESTTAEVQAVLNRRQIAGEQRALILRLLREIDQVKFARRPATLDGLSEKRGTAITAVRALDSELNAPSVPAVPSR